MPFSPCLCSAADPGPHSEIDTYRDDAAPSAPTLPLSLLDALRAFAADRALRDA